MHVAVTGANGSIGRRVVLLALQRGHTVLAIDTPLSSSSPTARLPSHIAFSSADALKEDEKTYISSHSSYTFSPADLTSYTETNSVLSSTSSPLEALIHMAGIPSPEGDVEAHNTNVVISWNVLHTCATLGINKVAPASSVNAIGIVFNQTRRFDYLPLDEEHPCRPDEQYGLSKLIAEMQATTITLRHPNMRIASLRISWSVPDRSIPGNNDRHTDLWGYVQRDSAADACLLAISPPEELPGHWNRGHEVFFVAAPRPTEEESFEVLRKRRYPDVRVKDNGPEEEWTGFYDCGKARRILGWVHAD